MDFRSQNLAQPLSADTPIVIVVGASPFAYKNQTNRTQQVIVQGGGGVTSTTYTRPGTGAIATGAAAGIYMVFPGDTLTVTYPGAAPTMTAVPM